MEDTPDYLHQARGEERGRRRIDTQELTTYH